MVREVIANSGPALAALLTGLLVLHILSGAVGLLSGVAALASRKGGRLHRRAGAVFATAMIVMAIAGGALAVQMPRAQWMNSAASVFTLYLVVTALVAMRNDSGSRRLEIAAMLLPASLIVAAALTGAGLIGPISRGQFAPFLVFTALGAMALAFDARSLLKSPREHRSRTARHLWRMSLALTIATAAFFLGQAQVLPAAIRGPYLAIIPLAALAALFFWLARTNGWFARPARIAAPG